MKHSFCYTGTALSSRGQNLSYFLVLETWETHTLNCSRHEPVTRQLPDGHDHVYLLRNITAENIPAKHPEIPRAICQNKIYGISYPYVII